MFNSNTYNSTTYNDGPTPSSLERAEIEFDGYDLVSLCEGGVVGTSGVMIKTVNEYDLANIDLSTFISGLTDGGGVVNKRYTDLTINMDLFILGTDYADLVSKVNELKAKTQTTEGYLSFKQPDGTRRQAKATLTSLKVGSLDSLTNFVDGVSATFRILEPFFSQEKSTSILYEGLTTSSQQVINYEGTYQTFPTFYLVFGTGNISVSKVEIEIKQPGDTTGFTIDIEEVISDGDLLEFDGVNKKVLLNQTEIDFNGIFEPLKIGNNFIDFNITASTLMVDIAVIYNNTFL